MRFHPNEDSLEEYILGRLDEQLTRKLELHLGGCAQCTERMKETRDYVQAMQAALAEVQPEN